MSTNPPAHLNGNGKARATLFPPSQKELKKRATQNPTRGYQPSGSMWYGYGTQALDGRPIFTWLDIQRMMTDPQVIFISQLWRAPFQKVQFTVKASSPQVAAFVQNTVKRFWRASLPKLLSRYFKYGFCAGGAEFETRQGWLRLARVKAVENRDVEVRVWKGGERHGEFAGFKLQNAGGAGSGTEWVGAPHAFYFAGHGEYSPFYGWPPLAGLFEPWLEKNGRGGARHLRRVWFRKNANRGKILRYPPGVTNCGTDENPQMRDNQDLAREILDYGETNSTYAFENTLQPGDSAKYEWEMEDDHPQGDVAGFLEYPKELDEEMVKGAGIPLEVIQGSDSGSGYKGRLVSYGGFLGTVDELTGLILESCEPWLAPAVALNYGPDAWYEVEPVSLAQIASEEEKRQPTNPVGQPLASLPPGGGGDGGSPASQFQAEGVKTSAPLPFELSALDYDDAAPARPVCYRFGLDTDPFRDFDPEYGVALVKVNPIEMSATGEPHEFGCAMIALPPTLADQVRSLAAKIPDSALAEKGREDSPHITVRFGFPGSTTADDLRPILADSPPVRVRLGGVSVFPGAASGKDYDVLKFDVDSAGLRRLNRELAVLPHTDTHKWYSPHVTIAYVKAGMGQALAALAQPLAAEFTAKEVIYADPAGSETVIPMGGPVEMSATSTSDDVDPKVKEQVFNQTQQKLMRTRKSTIAQLLALAMLRKQQSATAAGKPQEAAGSLQALAQLAGDPIQVARIVGMKEMSATAEEDFEAAWNEGPLELAWTAFTTKSGGIGAVSDTLRDQAGRPRKLYGKRAEDALGAHDRRQEKQAGSDTARAALQKLYAGTADFNDVIDLSNSVGHLTLKEINEARARLETVHGVGTGKRGERVKEQRINALLSYVDEKMAAIEAKKPKPAGAQVGPDGDTKTLIAAPATPPASGVAVIGPDGALEPDPVEAHKQAQAAAVPPPSEEPAPAPEPPAPQPVPVAAPPKVDRLAALKAKQAGKVDTVAPAPVVTPKGRRVKAGEIDPNDRPGSLADTYLKDVAEAKKLPAAQREKKIAELRAAFLKAADETAGPVEDINPEDGPVPEGESPLLNVGDLAQSEPEPAEPASRSNEPAAPDALVQKATKAFGELKDAMDKKRSPESVRIAVKHLQEAVAALPEKERARFHPDILDVAKRSKVGPVFTPEERAAQVAKIKGKSNPPAPAPTQKAAEVPESKKEPVADKVAEKLAAEPVGANPDKRPAAADAAKRAKKVPKVAPHIAAVQKVAAGIDDPVAKDYLEAAIHNHQKGSAADIAGALGRSIEEDYTAHTGKSIKREVTPVARAAVEKALGALGAKPEGKVGATVKYNSLWYEPPTDPDKENWFSDDPVRLVRAPFLLNGEVVAKGKVESIKSGSPPKMGTVEQVGDDLEKALEESRVKPEDYSPEKVNALLDRLLAGRTDDEVKKLSKRLTYRSGRTAKEARQRLWADLTAVHRLPQAQWV